MRTSESVLIVGAAVMFSQGHFGMGITLCVLFLFA